MTKSEILNGLFTKYGLIYDQNDPNNSDVFTHQHYKIITRSGIQKIEKAAGIFCEISLVSSGSNYANVIGRGYLPNNDKRVMPDYITTASANELSVKNKSGYFCEMAEKRCRSRLILTLAGLYELGVFGEDEAEAFSEKIKEERSSDKSELVTAKFKGRATA